ncbi:MAG: NAD(P)/FAD-dependent oxidoreductase [Bacteroidales bacterium]|nr:NAD(P)/FAD-dependent oxidoreductase [Bacteroidales bacterium]
MYDVIIVGGGLGGLTAGAKLAKEGKRVFLVEQHDRPGGCATTFNRKDYIMEVGLHEMDGLHPRDIKTKVFRDLGIFERVEFLELPEFYRFVNGRHDIVIPHDSEEAKTILAEHFPDELSGIKAYFTDVLNARKIISTASEDPLKNVGDWLDSIINNNDLKLALLGNLGYYHDDPYTLSYYYYITAQGAYYAGRANYIKGGSQQLSFALVDIIQENGGTVRLNALATKIQYKNDKPSGIEYQCMLKKEVIEELEAEIIVINSSLPGLAQNLLPEGKGDSLQRAMQNIKIGASLLTIYYGFKHPLQDIGCKNYSTFIYDESVLEQADILQNNKSDFDTRSFTFVDYGQIDSGLAPAGKSVGAVCCIDYLSDWEDLSKEEYKNRKKQAARHFTARLNKLMPGFTDAVDYVEVGTSSTVLRYTLNPAGAVYGFAQNPDKSLDYLAMLPENIFIASAWGKLGGGFSGAILSGYMTAFEILRRR